MKQRLLAAAVLLLMLTGCTALLDTGPVIEDDPITASGVDPVEEAIRTWDESHVPYRALPAMRPANMAELPDWTQSDAEPYWYWWKSGEAPEGYVGEEVLPGAADLDWQQAANRADAIRRAVGFPTGEQAVWELTWWPAGAEREWTVPAPPRAYYECMYDNGSSGDLTLWLDSVTGAVQLLQNNARDTAGRTDEMEGYDSMLYTAGISDADYAHVRESINGSAAPLSGQQAAMDTVGAALGLPALTWQAIPTDAGTDSLCPLPADRTLLDDSCLRWVYGIGLTADGGDGNIWLAEVDRACGVLRGLVCVPQEQMPAGWRPAG